MIEKYSYTKLSTYDSCPFKFYLKYRKKIQIYSDSCASLYGSLVHNILEKEALYIKNKMQIDYDKLRNYFLNGDNNSSQKKNSGKIYSVSDIKKMFPNEWFDTDTKSGKSYEEKAMEFAESGIYDFPNYMNEHPELEIIGSEVQFSFKYKNYMFSGFIDLLMRNIESGKYIIWDIKTKDHEFASTELTTPLQFVIYCMAIRERYGEDVDISCEYSLPVLGIRQDAGTKGFEKRGIKKIDKLLSQIEEEDFEANPTPLCYWCEFSNTNPCVTDNGKNICPYYSLWTKDNKTFEKNLPWTGLHNYDKQVSKMITLKNIESGDFFDLEI